MSNLISPRPRILAAPVGGKRHFPIVASQFNATYVQGLIDHTTAEWRTVVPGETTSHLEAPRTYEIAVVVRDVALEKRSDANSDIGVNLKDSTDQACN